MKTLILILILLCASISPAKAQSRQNGLIKFLAESSYLRNMGLEALMNNRCARYFGFLDNLACQESVGHMMKQLDIDMVIPNNKSFWKPSAFVFVAFKDEFLELMNSKNLTPFLMKANEAMSQHIGNPHATQNLWSEAMGHFKNKYIAAKVMAALFQDTSHQQLHIGYLYLKKGLRKSQVFSENQEHLERLLGTISMILDTREDNFQKIFYPVELKEELNRNIYHFYVPLYLSMKLKQIGFNNKFSIIGPFMMTLTYESVTYSGGSANLFDDPLQITKKGTLRDLFGGYCGANYGIYGNNFQRNFVEMSQNFQRSTHLAINELFRYY